MRPPAPRASHRGVVHSVCGGRGIRNTLRAVTSLQGQLVPTPFSEKSFYLLEFRGRTLAIAAAAAELEAPQALIGVLEELEANDTRVVLISEPGAPLSDLVGEQVLREALPGLEGSVLRALRERPRVGVSVRPDASFVRACREVALRLRPSKLVWIDAGGGLCRSDGSRRSFVDLEALRRLRRRRAVETRGRSGLLREIETLLAQGLPAVNVCSQEGLAEELFTYPGSGTLFTRERYVVVRPLGLDDYAAAGDLLARGEAEGYLAPRTQEQVDALLAHGFGAFVEGRHLGGIAALRPLERSRAGEISGLYTLTRFSREGIGAHLVHFAVSRAREQRLRCVFACTTSEAVGVFFERVGFRPVAATALPATRWRGYDPARRDRLRCFRHDLGEGRSRPHAAG